VIIALSSHPDADGVITRAAQRSDSNSFLHFILIVINVLIADWKHHRMKLATLLHDGVTSAYRLDEGSAVAIAGARDVGELLRDSRWRQRAAEAIGDPVALSDLPDSAWRPPVTAPSKIVCVGLNYRNHILEMGRELPTHPTLFAKFTEALIGAHDDIVVPPHAQSAVDWEGELAIIVGSTARNVDTVQAVDAIAGFTVLNDVTMRDYQYRTTQWLQGKTFEGSTPIGPYVVTADSFAGGRLTTTVDEDIVQDDSTDDLVFGPAALVSYISTIITLNPGDIIASGTPGGVGHGRTPARHLRAGEILATSVEGLGTLRNAIRFQ
jgi:acylpyruvate hydrolase